MSVSRRTGVASLPLHTGRAPPWLFGRMVRLAREILAHLVAEYGPDEVLRRLSDPFWFQAFGCVLGFDWHSRRRHHHGVRRAQGGGARPPGGLRPVRRRRQGRHLAPDAGRDHFRLRGSGARAGPLVKASRLAAKVDNTAVQDGHQLYHHSFVFTPSGSWCVVQQGMSDLTHAARRYHWLSEGLASFVDEPHAAVCCDARGAQLNMVASDSAPQRAPR